MNVLPTKQLVQNSTIVFELRKSFGHKYFLLAIKLSSLSYYLIEFCFCCACLTSTNCSGGVSKMCKKKDKKSKR